MADSAPISDFKWAFFPGLFWGLFLGALLGGFTSFYLGTVAAEDLNAVAAERGEIQKACIDGNDRACRVYEVRYGR